LNAPVNFIWSSSLTFSHSSYILDKQKSFLPLANMKTPHNTHPHVPPLVAHMVCLISLSNQVQKCSTKRHFKNRVSFFGKKHNHGTLPLYLGSINNYTLQTLQSSAWLEDSIITIYQMNLSQLCRKLHFIMNNNKCDCQLSSVFSISTRIFWESCWHYLLDN